MSKEILYSEDARNRMKNGLDKVANAVKVTLGPRGRNVVLKKSYGTPDVTKDGVTVAREITLKDPYEDAGAQLCREAAITADGVGDGTTTATILAQAMVTEGLKYSSSSMNAIEIKKGIDRATDYISNLIKKSSEKVDVTDLEALKNIATISGNDTEIGDIVGSAFHQVGENGIVTYEEAKSTKTQIEVTKGFHFDRGYMAPHFITDIKKMACELDDALVLLWDKRITNPHDLVPLLNSVVKASKSLVIISDEIEGEALATLVLNKMNGTLKVVAVRAPGYGERKANIMEDMAIFTGGIYFSEHMGKSLDKVSITDLGSVKKVIVDKDTCTLVGGAGEKEKLDEHVDNLKSQLKESDSQYDREKLSERIGKLLGSVAIIKIGSKIESELKEKKYRYQDAISATKAAIEEGILPGGGTVLYRIHANSAKIQKELNCESTAEAAGVHIVLDSLQKPINTILQNGGFQESHRIKILQAVEKGKGYDGRTGEIIASMKTRGIIDPVRVVRSSLESASAVVGIFLTTEAIVIDAPEESNTPAKNNAYQGMF